MHTNTETMDELLFAECFYNHYRQLYLKYRNGWEFKKAFFYWKRMRKYKEDLQQLQQATACTKSVVNEVNQTYGYPHIAINN